MKKHSRLVYGLAIYYRRQPAIHGRYMLCTVFPFITPVTDRLTVAHWPSLIGLVPVLDGTPLVPVLEFILADVALAVLAIWDWRANRRTNVFPVALLILVAYHVSVVTFYAIPLWRSFGEWFLSLPLS